MTEMAIVVGTTAILMGGLLTLQQGRLNNARALRTVQEAQTIAEASVQRFRATGAWPTSVDELGADVQGGGANPFGAPYAISGTGRRVLVSTTVPVSNVPTSAGTGVSITTAAGSTTVTVSRTLADRGVTSAAFDKRYLYEDP